MSSVNTLFALVKVAIWIVIIFYFFAGKVFQKSKKNTKKTETIFANAVKLAFSSVIIIHGLSLLGILDMGTIILSFVSLLAGRLYYEDKSKIKTVVTNFWVKAHEILFDLLDGAIKPKEIIKSKLSSMKTENFAFFIVPLKTVTIGGLALAPVFQYFFGFMDYPLPETIREFANIEILKNLMNNDFLKTGYYPSGAQSLVVLLRSLTLLDEIFLWKLLNILLASLTTLITFFSIRSIVGKKYFFAPFLGASFSVLFNGSLLTRGMVPTTEVHPWHFAGPLLIMCFVIIAKLKEFGKKDLITIWISSTLIAMVHPLAWLVLMTGTSFSVLGNYYLFKEDYKNPYYPIIGILSGVIIPLILGLILFSMNGLHADSLILREIFEPGATNLIKGFEDIPILVFGAFSAVVLLTISLDSINKEKRSYYNFFSASFLGIWSLSSLQLFGIPQKFVMEGLRVLTLPLAALCSGLFLNYFTILFMETYIKGIAKKYYVHYIYKFRPLIPVVLVVTLLFIFPPKFPKPKERMESVSTLQAFFNLREEYDPFSWTVVGHDELFFHSLGYGNFIKSEEFLANGKFSFSSAIINIMQEFPLAPHTFLISDNASGVFRKKNNKESKGLDTWSKEYMRYNTDMSIFYKNEHATIYHIDTTKKKKVTKK